MKQDVSSEISDNLSRFRQALLLYRPFYGDILLHLPIVEDPRVETACTDGFTIRWNPDFFRHLTPEQQRYVLMHEVFHVLLLHPSRMRHQADVRLFNVAADMVVNNACDMLLNDMRRLGTPDLQMARPPDGVFANIDQADTAEDLYARLLEDNRRRSDKNRVNLRKQYRWYSSRSGGDLTSVPIPASDLQPGPDGKPLTPEQEKQLESMLRQWIREAAGHSRSPFGSGYVPPGVLQLVKPAPLNWKTVLRDFLTEAESDDTSYATPERKYLHMDLILPGHSKDDTGELETVWAFVDSSGSIGRDDMNQFLTQLYRLVKEFHCELNLCYWDTEVTDVYRRIRTEKQVLQAVPKHSGGTDINCVYRWLTANKVKPDVQLILTDGYFGVPDEARFKSVIRRDHTILIICNESENAVYRRVGKVCRLVNSKKG